MIPGSERSTEGGNGNPLQYSCLENPMDTEACWAIVHRVTKCQMRLNTHDQDTVPTIMCNTLGCCSVPLIVRLLTTLFWNMFLNVASDHFQWQPITLLIKTQAN